MLRAAAILLALLLFAPSAAAFASQQEELLIAYPADSTPAVLATGALFVDGSVTGAILIGGSDGTKLERIPLLRFVEQDERGVGRTETSGATIELLSGALLWTLSNGASATVATSVSYAIGLALPQAPIPDETGAQGAGFLLASDAVTGTITTTGATQAVLVPLDAVVTVRDASGRPLDGWDARTVNPGANAQMDPDILPIVFETEGGFTARVAAKVVGGGTGGASALRMVIGPAAEDRFDVAVGALDEIGKTYFGAEDAGFSSAGGALDMLAGVSGVLNGAFIIVPGGEDVGEPISSHVGNEEFPLGPFTLVRGEAMELAWTQGQLRMSGTPVVALGAQGFAVDKPASIGVIPIVSLVLWLIAIGAVVYYFARRPPKAPGPWSLRLASIGVYVVVFLVVLFLWDRSFEASFGTGILTTYQNGGLTPDNLPRLGAIAGLELALWSFAAFLFALPVRIALGVGLRYLGKGKSFKGLASAGGLVALIVFGPFFALYGFNLIWSRVAANMG